MFFDAKMLVALVFIIINFLIIFVIRTRTTTVTILIIAHLMLVLFLSLSISNYNSFKEVVLALVAYSMVVLFLISNHNQIFSDDSQRPKIKGSSQSFFVVAAVLSAVAVIFCALFLITKNVPKISQMVSNKKLEKQNEIMMNPMILPSHPVHIAIKKFYLGKKIEDDGSDWLDKAQIQAEINDRKQARLKDKLSDNFLLKRSSDVILIIVAISTSLLLLASKNQS